MGSGGSKKNKEAKKEEEPTGEPDYVFKVVIVRRKRPRYLTTKMGDFGVGKTSILERYTRGVFEDTEMKTLDADVREKTIRVGSSTVKLKVKQCASRFNFQICDTAGRERVSYYGDAQIALMVYDVTNNHSFENVMSHLQVLDRGVDHPYVTGVIGNKADLSKYVTTQKAKEYCDSLHFPLFEVSAKTGENIDAAFLALAKAMIESADR